RLSGAGKRVSSSSSSKTLRLSSESNPFSLATSTRISIASCAEILRSALLLELRRRTGSSRTSYWGAERWFSRSIDTGVLAGRSSCVSDIFVWLEPTTVAGGAHPRKEQARISTKIEPELLGVQPAITLKFQDSA